MWYGDETVGFCRRDTRVITDGCSLLRGCWNAFFKNMLFKRGSLSESQMAASPTGNIRSFCSEDALGWLIQTSKNKKLWWGFFFFFTPSSHARAKLPMSRGGFGEGPPLEALNWERSQRYVLLTRLLSGVWRQSSGWIFHRLLVFGPRAVLQCWRCLCRRVPPQT